MADSIVSFKLQRSIDGGQHWSDLQDLTGDIRSTTDFNAPANASYRLRGLTTLGFEIPYNDVTPPGPPPPPTSGEWIWQVPIKGVSVTDRADIVAVAVDSANNYAVVGTITGSVDFGGQTKASAGERDAFVAKYNLNGTLQWVNTYGDGFDQYATCVAFDSSNNLFVGGQFAGTMTVDGVTLTNTPVQSFPYATYDIYILKLGPLGNRLWAKSFPGSGSESCFGIGVDPDQNIIIGGIFGLPQALPVLVPFNLGGGDILPGTPVDLYVAKFTGADGTFVWAVHHGGVGGDRFNFASNLTGVAVDSSGDVAICGSITGGTINLGGADLPTTGGNSIVAKYSGSSGAHLWSQVYRGEAGAGTNLARSIAVNGVKDVFVTGGFVGSINIAGIVLHTPQPTSGVYVTRLGSATGQPNFANVYGGNFFAEDSGYSIAIDPQQNILVCGTVQGSFIDFGGGPRFGDGTLNIFIAKFDQTGAWIWDKRIQTGATKNYAKAIKSDNASNVVVGGFFDGTINFGGPNINGNSDQTGFFVKFKP